MPAAESLVEDERLLMGDSGGPLQDEAGTKQYTATCNAVQPETQCLEEPSEAVGRASSPVQKKCKKPLKSSLKVCVATTRGFTLMPKCSNQFHNGLKSAALDVHVFFGMWGKVRGPIF